MKGMQMCQKGEIIALISPFCDVFLSFLFGLYLFHYPKEISAPYLGDVCFCKSVLQQADGDIDKIIVSITSFDTASTVEVRTDAYVVYACHFNHVQQVFHEVREVGFPGIRGQEFIYQAGLSYTAVCSKGA